MLELVEEPLDQIALPINAPIDCTMHQALSGRGNMCLGTAGPDQIEQSIGIIATVGDDVAALEACEQMRRCTQVMSLACGQHEPHGKAFLIDHRIDLGAQSSTRTADGVILALFFPPAACW